MPKSSALFVKYHLGLSALHNRQIKINHCVTVFCAGEKGNGKCFQVSAENTKSVNLAQSLACG